ncbi:MAG: hypothetical protein AAF721_29355, partial [Myxococcota bacterium]
MPSYDRYSAQLEAAAEAIAAADLSGAVEAYVAAYDALPKADRVGDLGTDVVAQVSSLSEQALFKESRDPKPLQRAAALLRRHVRDSVAVDPTRDLSAERRSLTELEWLVGLLAASQSEPESPAAPVGACEPECRSGFSCVRGQCVSACNPACDPGLQCTNEGRCVGTAVAVPRAEAVPRSTEEVEDRAEDERGSRRGVTVAVGTEFDYARVIYRAFTLTEAGTQGQEYAATGGLVSLSTVLQADYGFTDRVFAGLRFGTGGILNSDNTTGSRLRVQLGPALTAFVTKNFYVGADFLFEYLSFDNINPKFPGVQAFDAEGSEAVGDIDAKTLLGLTWAFRLGGTIPLAQRLVLVPELRLRGNFKYFSKEGVDVDHLDDSGA